MSEVFFEKLKLFAKQHPVVILTGSTKANQCDVYIQSRAGVSAQGPLVMHRSKQRPATNHKSTHYVQL